MKRIPNQDEWVTIPKDTTIYQYGQYGVGASYRAGTTYKVRVWRVMEVAVRNFPDFKGKTFIRSGERWVDVVAWFVKERAIKMAPLEAVKEIPSDIELLSQVTLDNPRRRS